MIRQTVVCTMIKHGSDLHNDQTYFDNKICRWEHLELKLKSKLKLSNICTYIISHSFPPKEDCT